MNTDEIINKIVWWIPSLKIRNFIRYLYSNIKKLTKDIEELKENNKLLQVITIQNKILFLQQQSNYKLEYNLFSKRFIVIKVSNGLVDQMYTYCTGYSISKNYNIKVKYDLSYYNSVDNRKFELLNVFKNLDFEVANENEINIAKSMFYIDERYGGDYELINYIINNNRVIYFDTRSSFSINIKRIFLKDIYNLDSSIFFRLDEKNLIIYYDILYNQYSIACHIRRTDYLTVDYSRYNLNEDYYIYAINKLKSQLKLEESSEMKIYFFSDDIEWVKNKLIPLVHDYNYLIIDINNGINDYFDFYLISKCKYQIASLGKFCKTAYEFNSFKNKILISPENVFYK